MISRSVVRSLERLVASRTDDRRKPGSYSSKLKAMNDVEFADELARSVKLWVAALREAPPEKKKELRSELKELRAMAKCWKPRADRIRRSIEAREATIRKQMEASRCKAMDASAAARPKKSKATHIKSVVPKAGKKAVKPQWRLAKT